MFLGIDIGNTNIVLSIFDSGKLIYTQKITSDTSLTQDEYSKILFTNLEKFEITDCGIVSVVEELNLIIKNACDKTFNTKSFLLTSQDNLGLDLRLDNPETVGLDRIANAYCAKIEYKLPAIIIDIGTATTFDIVSKDGEFLGGIIMPGMDLQFKSLNDYTSKLPLINYSNSDSPIGNNTKNAILSGVIRGSACAIEGLITQCEEQLGCKPTTIATGGGANFVENYMKKKFDFIDSNLTLKGIKYLYELNRNH